MILLFFSPYCKLKQDKQIYSFGDRSFFSRNYLGFIFRWYPYNTDWLINFDCFFQTVLDWFAQFAENGTVSIESSGSRPACSARTGTQTDRGDRF